MAKSKPIVPTTERDEILFESNILHQSQRSVIPEIAADHAL
jgi:hypothetical protein